MSGGKGRVFLSKTSTLVCRTLKAAVYLPGWHSKVFVLEVKSQNNIQ
jgi:hypothetical protein